MFAKMWQTESLENPGAAGARRMKMVNLVGAYNWVFTDTTDKNGTGTVETTFTMTGTPQNAGSSSDPKPGIVFTNHLISSANGTELKFDVDITGFADDWWQAEAQGLVMAYQINTVDGTQADAARNMTLRGVSHVSILHSCLLGNSMSLLAVVEQALSWHTIPFFFFACALMCE
jgi:hypothetical protein